MQLDTEAQTEHSILFEEGRLPANGPIPYVLATAGPMASSLTLPYRHQPPFEKEQMTEIRSSSPDERIVAISVVIPKSQGYEL